MCLIHTCPLFLSLSTDKSQYHHCIFEFEIQLGSCGRCRCHKYWIFKSYMMMWCIVKHFKLIIQNILFLQLVLCCLFVPHVSVNGTWMSVLWAVLRCTCSYSLFRDPKFTNLIGSLLSWHDIYYWMTTQNSEFPYFLLCSGCV